jgi:hypothetical protein
MCAASFGLRPGDEAFQSNSDKMGSTPFGDSDPTALASVSPRNVKIVRGIPGCAMASDRI